LLSLITNNSSLNLQLKTGIYSMGCRFGSNWHLYTLSNW